MSKRFLQIYPKCPSNLGRPVGWRKDKLSTKKITLSKTVFSSPITDVLDYTEYISKGRPEFTLHTWKRCGEHLQWPVQEHH